ncbi:MAG: TolC family protein, partial [Planctomycetota bacterium]
MRALAVALFFALWLASAAGGSEASAESSSPLAPETKPGVELTLRDCVLIALRNNVDLRRQRLSDRSAELTRSSALAEFLPSLKASGDLDRSEVEDGGTAYTRSGSVTLSGKTPWGTSISGTATQSRDREGDGSDSASSVSANLRQPLLYGGGLPAAFYDYRTSRLNRAASREDLVRQAQLTVYNVRRLYWSALKNGLVVQANRQALDSANRFLETARARLKAEQASKLDVSGAEIQRSSREVALTSAEATLEDSLDNLKESMDLALSERVALPVDVPEYRAPPRDPGKLLTRALERRPDLLAARERLEVKRLDVGRKRRNAWPTLDLVAGYSISGAGGSTADSHNFDDRRGSVGLELNVPLGLVKRRNDYRKASLELHREELSLHKKEVAVERELRAVMRDLRAAERNLASYRKRVEAAELAAAAAKALYERGKA